MGGFWTAGKGERGRERQRKGKGERVLSVLSQRAVKIARHSKLFQREHDVRSISPPPPPPLLLIVQFFDGAYELPSAFPCNLSDTFLKMQDIDHIICIKHSLNRLDSSTSLTMSLSGLAPSSSRQTYARGPLTKRAKEGRRRRSRLCPRRQSSPNRTPICRARSCFVIGLRLKFNFGCLGIGK